MKKRQTTYGMRRNRRKMFHPIGTVHPIVALAAVTLLIFAAWRLTAADGRHPQLSAGNSRELLKVGTDGTQAEQIVEYTGFTVSYNAEAHQPNYVAWELTGRETEGRESRDAKWDVDRSVCGTAELSDYRRSGFDRGHMTPAADVKWDAEAMRESHLLTNICPQDHKLNAGAWATLESNCRQWAVRDSAIIIICGPVLSDYMPRTIGPEERKIPVPERFFKVVLSPYSVPPRGIGFLMNNGPVEGGVQASAVTIDMVEAVTGYDFFASLPDDIENEVEAQCAYHEWQRKKR